MGFGRTPSPPPASMDPADGSVIASDTELSGELRGRRSVRVEGRVRGTVELEASLEIAAGATVEAEVRAVRIRIGGTVVGNVTASELVELLAGSMVRGDVKTPCLHVVEGAVLEGRVIMQTEAPAASPVSNG
jgi:cytoskeletal protein CcmA (bactofilin family)